MRTYLGFTAKDWLLGALYAGPTLILIGLTPDPWWIITMLLFYLVVPIGLVIWNFKRTRPEAPVVEEVTPVEPIHITVGDARTKIIGNYLRPSDTSYSLRFDDTEDSDV